MRAPWWLWLPDGRTEVQSVGVVKKSASKGEELTLDEEKIFWKFDSNKVTFVYWCFFLSAVSHNIIKWFRITMT